MYVTSWVTTTAGNRIALRCAGPDDAPAVVFLHGWAQSGRCWQHQLAGPLAETNRLVAVDLRGHGESDDPGEYRDGAQWAADLAAVLATVTGPAVLVGWSYGGLVIADYLRAHGTANVRGLLLAGAITEIGRGHPGGRVGAAMRQALPAALSADPAAAVPALAAFIDQLAPGLDPVLHQHLLGDALRTAPGTRAAMFDRDVDSAAVLAAVDVPTAVIHGAKDTVVDPRAAEYAAELIPGAALDIQPDTGHLPFAERPAEFHTVLAGLL